MSSMFSIFIFSNFRIFHKQCIIVDCSHGQMIVSLTQMDHKCLKNKEQVSLPFQNDISYRPRVYNFSTK